MAKTVTALIVDDDRNMQRLLADALAEEGFNVCVEKDGDWALKTFQKRSIQIIVLDVLLPAVNGYEVARRLRLSPKGAEIPLVFISGVYRSAAQRREAIEKYRAAEFLEKPFKLPQLIAALKRALGADYPDPAAARAERERIEHTDPGLFADKLAAAAEAQAVEAESNAEARRDRGVMRGNLRDKSFAELLAELYRQRADGALLVRRDKVKKIVYFRGGHPYFIKSNLLSETLGNILVKEKMISTAECEESLARMKSSKRQQGTVLIEMGCISPPNLQYALTLQLQTKLFDVFGWDEGDYQFNARAELPQEATGLEMTCAAAIYEGLKRARPLDLISEIMQPLQGKYVHPASDPLYRFQDAGLDEEEQALLNACDGRKTVRTLEALSILPPQETLRLLLAMRYAQMVEFRDEAAQAPERPVTARQGLVVPWDTAAESAQATAPNPIEESELKTELAIPGRLIEGEDREDTAVDLKPFVPGEPPLPEGRIATETEPEGRVIVTPSSAIPAGPPPLPRRTVPPAPAPAAAPNVVARAAGSLLPELSGIISVHVSAEERSLREKLAGTVVALKKKDLFQVLRVPPNASADDIKNAYFALAKEYHPDRHFKSASAEVRNLANEIYQLISNAYETLREPESREQYVADLARGIKKDVSDEVSKILAAEGKFQRGEELLRKKQYGDAHAAFQEAVELYDQEGEFHAYLGWTLFQTDPRNPEIAQEAMDAIETAIRLNPKVDKSYLFLGYIYKATGRPDKAEAQFERAIQCNPDCTEALRELRLLGKNRR